MKLVKKTQKVVIVVYLQWKVAYRKYLSKECINATRNSKLNNGIDNTYLSPSLKRSRKKLLKKNREQNSFTIFVMQRRNIMSWLIILRVINRRKSYCIGCIWIDNSRKIWNFLLNLNLRRWWWLHPLSINLRVSFIDLLKNWKYK